MIERISEVRTPKLESKLVLFYYLSKFPLFGYKYFDQFYLNQIQNLFLNKEHKTLEDKAKLIQYTNLKIVEVNNKPSWDHLNNFEKKQKLIRYLLLRIMGKFYIGKNYQTPGIL
jgi:hypothetical protein